MSDDLRVRLEVMVAEWRRRETSCFEIAGDEDRPLDVRAQFDGMARVWRARADEVEKVMSR